MQEAGYMGLTEREFFDITPRFFSNALKGFEKRERTEWERARMVAYYSFFGTPKKRVQEINKFIRFHWEGEIKEIINPYKDKADYLTDVAKILDNFGKSEKRIIN